MLVDWRVLSEQLRSVVLSACYSQRHTAARSVGGLENARCFPRFTRGRTDTCTRARSIVIPLPSILERDVISFRWRRRIHRMQLWWQTDQFLIDCRNLVYWIKHPITWLEVRRYQVVFRQGKTIIQA